MGALVIEDFDELVEAGLLLEEIGCSGLCGFLLKGQVHALMTPVLLRGTGFNSFDANT